MGIKPVLINRYFYLVGSKTQSNNIYQWEIPGNLMQEIIQEQFGVKKVDAFFYEHSVFMRKRGNGEIITIKFLNSEESHEFHNRQEDESTAE